MMAEDNLANVSWAIIDAAWEDYQQDKDADARNKCLSLLNNAYTPVSCSA